MQRDRVNFDPLPHLGNRLTDFDETRNLELTLEDHPPSRNLISIRRSTTGGLGYTKL